jgi:serine/threonine-protein kinase
MAYGDPPRLRSAERSQARFRSAGEPVPPGWQLQPPDPNWNGKRYVSPNGAAWFAVYTSPADHEPVAAHLKTVAFADGEEVTYLRGERDWIAVSGLKGDRIFYRKAVLACGGKTWRHIAFEYPVDAKRRMDSFVTRAAGTLDGSDSEGCETVSSSR